MTTVLRERFASAKADLKKKTKKSGWVLEKQSSTFADKDRWSNIDADVTPVSRRTWTVLTVLGFWISVRRLNVCSCIVLNRGRTL